MSGVGGDKSKHPDYFLASISHRQWQGWQLYTKHFGSPRLRGDLYTGTIAYYVAAPHLKRRMGITDFMPKWGVVIKRMTTETMKAMGQAWAMACGRMKGARGGDVN